MARILIVDDDKDILKFTDALLSQSGHDVKIAIDPLSAIDLLSGRDFDLIITDANMPHYTGFELIKTVRGEARHKDIAIAMLTGMREKESIEKAIKAGVDDYIVKPIDPMIFIRKIDDLLKKRPPRKQMELVFSAVTRETDAKVLLETKIAAVTESGLKILTHFNLPEGSLISLQTDFFRKIDIEPPALRVISCQKQENEYLLILGYVGLSEVEFEKIRSWIHQEINKQKLKAT